MKTKDVLEVTEFTDYKAFLRAKIAEQPKVGYQTQLAKAAGCTPSFLSQALNSSVHLTPDQGAGLASFWQLPELDADYFLALVNEARAATPALKQMVNRTKDAIREKKFNLAKRFQAKRFNKSESEFLYYSGWQWAAVHVLLSVPKYRSIQALADRIGLSAELVREYARKLEQMGLVKPFGNRENAWQTTEHNLHLPKDSPVTPLHHMNWRQRANENCQRRDPESIHYTAIHGLSVADMDRIRHLILKVIEESRAIVAPSKEEEVACFTCDFFRI